MKVPNYTIPQRNIVMMNGETWQFRFDNACIDHMDRHYDSAPSPLQMMHSLTAYQQEVLNGEEVSYSTFKSLMPPIIEPEIKAAIDGLMTEVQVKRERAAALTGNAPLAQTAKDPILPPQPDSATCEDDTCGKSSSG